MENARPVFIHPHQTYGPGVSIREIAPIDDPEASCPFGLLEFLVEAHSTSEPHSHGSAEIWRIETGFGRVHTEDGVLEVKAGDLVYLRPNTTHCLENLSDGRITALSMYWTRRP